MKFFLRAAIAASTTTVVDASTTTTGDRTITQVINLLKQMLTKSKEDGKADKTTYGKFECYCNKNEEEKANNVTLLERTIETRKAEIQSLQGHSSKLSKRTAELEADMQANVDSRTEATTVRGNQHNKFILEEQDLVGAIADLNLAVQTLSAVGGDQTQSTGEDHAKFMAADATAAAKENALVSLKAKLGRSLALASELAPHKAAKARSLLQAPFTGVYTSQSVEIVGILKNMRDTFETNLQSARDTEQRQLTAYDAFIATATADHGVLQGELTEKQGALGDNDTSLSGERTLLSTDEGNLSNDQEFLTELTSVCASKKKEYEKRVLLRSREETAISEAITVLTSDAAFTSFGKVEATNFNQVALFAQIRSHDNIRARIAKSLKKDASRLHSARLQTVANAMANNPFAKVLELMDKVIKGIDDEEQADVDKKAFCDEQRGTTDTDLSTANADLMTVEGTITNKDIELNGPDGHKEALASQKVVLSNTIQSQKDAVVARRDEHKAYAESVHHLVKSKTLLERALHVLRKYYTWLHRATGPHHFTSVVGKDSSGGDLRRVAGASNEELESACSEDPHCAGYNSNGWLKSKVVEDADLYDAPSTTIYRKVYETASPVLVQQPVGADAVHANKPDTWETESDGYDGQKTDGHSAIGLIEGILTNTQTEEDTANMGEQQAQKEFETLMTGLSTTEKNTKNDIIRLEGVIVETEQELAEAHLTKEQLGKHIRALEYYLEELKPGCEFLDNNYDQRKTNRDNERSALEQAITKLRETPAFAAAVASQEKEDLGACASVCMTDNPADKDAVECKACQAETTVVGYCAGHPNTPGCAPTP